MKNLDIILLSFIFSFLVIINAKILTFFWVPEVIWWYEFTKSIIFNIIFSIFSIYFFTKNFKKEIFLPKAFFAILIVFCISIFVSAYPLTNIFWNNLKWHWLIFLTNLLILFITLINIEKNKIEKLFKFITIQSFFIFLTIIFWFFFISKENNILFFSYPNYISLYCLMIFPFLLQKIKISFLDKNEKNIKLWSFSFKKYNFSTKIYFLNLILLIITLFLTKSALSIIILIVYLNHFFKVNLKSKAKKIWNYIIFFLTLLLIILFFKIWIKTELNSIISKFFVWESTYNSISWNIFNTIFWLWNDSFLYVFESYKSKYLYIFENIWFNVDRSSNILLHILYTFWIVWLIFFINSIYSFFLTFKKEAVFYHITLIFLIFSLFNFLSIINYFLIIVIVSLIYIKWEIKKYYKKTKIFIIFFSIISAIWSGFYYFEETKLFKNEKYISNNLIFKSLKLENKEKNVIKLNNDIFKMCENLLKINKSSESFFYCWNFFWDVWYKNLAQVYYKKWIEKIPNLWDEKSPYFNNIFVKYLFSKEKFFDKEYSNILEILKRVKENNK